MELGRTGLEFGIKLGGGRKRDFREGIQGKASHSNDYLGGYMETYYSRTFLKKTQIGKKSKWSHEV